MFSVLANRTYRHLLMAQVIALLGTGLATVALGLLAYDIAGGEARAVLGTALAIKMVAYIGVAPVVGAYANRLPRRAFLVAMDLLRAGVALSLPFVTEVWQIYILIFVLQSASAAFTPTFQATIPDVLPDERDYTKALSLSRLAYDMESLISPILAAGLLTLINFHWLFSGTMIGFLASALLVVTTVLPRAPTQQTTGRGSIPRPHGGQVLPAYPRLRGLLALTLASAAASSMVIVNTVVIVRDKLGLGQQDVALTLAAFGAGSILAAFTLPRDPRSDFGPHDHAPVRCHACLASGDHGPRDVLDRRKPQLLVCPARRMVRDGHCLFDERHPLRPTPQTLGQGGRSTGIVCRTICP
ncbi:hypothetical protein GCM10020258_51750 [Sphingomonas yabuuchiae]